MKERITPKDDIEIYNAVTNEKTDKTQVLKWALCGKDYEDLEEQGLIVRLPCNVGDKVYSRLPNNKFSEWKVITIKIDTLFDRPHNTINLCREFKICGKTDYKINTVTWEEFNHLFLTEAEKKLKELKGEEE